MDAGSGGNELEAHLAADGLLVCIPEELEFTYQVIEGFDASEPVLASWNGEELGYILVFEKLPPGWLDAEKWIKGFLRTIKMTSKLFTFKKGAEGGFDARQSDFRGKYIEYRYVPRGDTDSCYQLVYFIANNESSYVATATAISADAGSIRTEMSKVIESATPADNIVSIRENEKESGFVGVWQAEYQNNKEESIDVLLSLEPGGVFKFREKEEVTEKVSPYTGSWYESDGKLFCVFIFTKPRSDRFRDYSDEAFWLDGSGQLVMEVSERGEELAFVQLQD